jgi:hypothetical protein
MDENIEIEIIARILNDELAVYNGTNMTEFWNSINTLSSKRWQKEDVLVTEWGTGFTWNRDCFAIYPCGTKIYSRKANEKPLIIEYFILLEEYDENI